MRGWFLAGVVLIAVLALDAFALQRLPVELERRAWPTAEAEVTHNDLRVVTTGTGRNRSRSYRLSFGYRFQADGRGYAGDETPLFHDLSYVSERHPVGSTLTVAYDPDAPSENLPASDVGPRSARWWATGLALAVLHLMAAELVRNALLASRHPDSGGVPVRRDTGGRIRLVVQAHSPASWLFLGLMCGGGLVAIARVPGVGLLTAPMWLQTPMILGLALWLWRHQKLGSGALDMVIDTRTRQLRMPRGSNGRPLYRLSELQKVAAVSHGRGRSRSDWLQLEGAGFSDRALQMSHHRAQGLARWMMRQPWFGSG